MEPSAERQTLQTSSVPSLKKCAKRGWALNCPLHLDGHRACPSLREKHQF